MHKFNKALGQNFLRNDRFAEKLIEPLSLTTQDVVIEIGPGDGRVTNLLLKTGAKVLAIEKDYSLVPKLIARFNNEPNFELVNQDILDVNIWEVVEQHFGKVSTIKVAGSLPYNISKMIIDKFVKLDPRPVQMSFIVQEEVAKVYTAPAPKATFLSNWIGLYANVKKNLSIPASQFFPVPKVNGAIIVFNPIPASQTLVTQEKLLLAGFKSPRKTLWNNLSSVYFQHKDKLAQLWQELQISSTIRAAELAPEQWTKLAVGLDSSI